MFLDHFCSVFDSFLILIFDSFLYIVDFQMKRVAHDIEPETGLIKGVVVNEEELENRPKVQMVS